MSDCIRLPRSALTEELWRNGNMARLYLFLLSASNESGGAEVSLREIERQTNLTLKEIRVGLDKLERAQKTARKRAQKTAQITICGISDMCEVGARKRAQKTAQITAQPQDGFERFRDYFNTAVADTSIPQITKLTDTRKNALRLIFKEYDRNIVEHVIQKVLASDFLSRDWGKVSFDWIFKKANFIKILEGNYDNKTRQAPTTDKHSARRGTDVGNHTEADYGGPF